MPTIQLKRGLKANLPATAAAGEILITTDTHEISIGTGSALNPLKIDAANVTNLPAGAVTSVFGRTGAVVKAANDYNFTDLAGTLAAGQLPAVLDGGTF